MKKTFLSRITAIVLSVLMVFTLCACDAPQSANYPKNGARKIVEVTKNLYASLEKIMPLQVAHYENQSEILLIEINTAVAEFIAEAALGASPSASVEVEEKNTTVKLTRENGAYCEIDFVKDTIFYSDFDNFNLQVQSDNPLDMLAMPYLNEQGENIFIKRVTSFYTPGYAIEIDLAERDIPLDIYEGKKYIPLQTFNDLFLVPYGINIAYNSKDLFVISGGALSPDLEQIYYLEQETPRSNALAEFNYNELCLYLDLYYGLQNEHGFNNGFSYYLEKIGLKEKFLEPSALGTFNALGSLTLGYMADSHSAIKKASPYLGTSQPEEGLDIKLSTEIISKTEISQEYQLARAQQLGEVNFYQKVGNTAYITFDEFTLIPRTSYDDAIEYGDTLSIIIASHQLISQDEEIENVVVDLSCNGGGAVDSAVYLTAWMLGYCDFSIYNSITESRATTNYYVDVNLDGVFDENDSIKDKNLYCLISPVSFSCGNYVPALLKTSDKVTLIGKKSSGGGCIVNNGVLADGTLFGISDAKQMSIVKNGTYYSVDGGVEPHVELTKIESFYNREVLTEFINNLK